MITVMQKGILYIVSTPIGNLEDITLRAIRILKEVRLIGAEDTRRTKILLDTYGIDTPLTSLHDRNELKKSVHLIARLNEGMDIAYVSDAGTPGISDPGYIFVKQAISESIRVVPVPGPVAAIAALNVSGLPMDSFVFFAFLPSRHGKRRQMLESIKIPVRNGVINWDCKDTRGEFYSSGIYLVKIEGSGKPLFSKFLMLR